MGKGSLQAQLHRIIGPEATERLIEKYRHGFLYVPESVGPDHHLSQAIGLENANRLASEFAGNRLLIPGGYAGRIAKRNQAIVEARAAGATVQELARRHGICIRQVYGILAKESVEAD